VHHYFCRQRLITPLTSQFYTYPPYRLYNQWFQIADVDRDGMLSGPEAVQFFLRSGLPKTPTLFRIWQFVAGDRPALNRQEFYTAMKLVAQAQVPIIYK